MAAAVPNLWPPEIVEEGEMPPANILREQAGKLREITRGKVRGKVESSIGKGTFRASFYVEATIGYEDYTARILAISHGVEFYPLSFEADFGGARLPIADRARFEKALRDLFASEDVKKLLKSLVAQAD